MSPNVHSYWFFGINRIPKTLSFVFKKKLDEIYLFIKIILRNCFLLT
ncbi:hypothetical protein GILI108418_11365 [Gillisia limnaea]|uniref:Uncharacterized protein n=1 Tax=Gillisia limnaea (strain DSM 15749 / LMG 21470 / R-8282) TaxID=865937 RepID=H2BWE7_GILLR|nr:hypothetical protein Gilli_1221 [Gillisia limnaea DSM 15749]